MWFMAVLYLGVIENWRSWRRLLRFARNDTSLSHRNDRQMRHREERSDEAIPLQIASLRSQ
jgi:hypothetical protein